MLIKAYTISILKKTHSEMYKLLKKIMLFNSVPEKKNMNLVQNDALIRLHIYLKKE